MSSYDLKNQQAKIGIKQINGEMQNFRNIASKNKFDSSMTYFRLNNKFKNL